MGTPQAGAHGYFPGEREWKRQRAGTNRQRLLLRCGIIVCFQNDESAVLVSKGKPASQQETLSGDLLKTQSIHDIHFANERQNDAVLGSSDI